jgi:DnaJ-class molecular chaperone
VWVSDSHQIDEITLAYEVLTDNVARQEYDLWLQSGGKKGMNYSWEPGSTEDFET